MNYQSYEDMADVIRRNLWKIPADIDIVVGVPRSGLIAALMIAELLNKPCGAVTGQSRFTMLGGGIREQATHTGIAYKILFVEDVVNTGYSINQVKEGFSALRDDNWEMIFAAVYVEGPESKDYVDIYLQDNYNPADSDWFYEWNILHHSKSDRCLWDIDGLLCKNPPDDRDTAAYEQYISNPLPMVIPTYPVGGFVTYRLEKYRAMTQDWLKRQGIKYQQLVMFPADDRDTRNAQMSPAIFKANIYRSLPQFKLFVESDASQAELISAASGKPVYCYENGKLYK